MRLCKLHDKCLQEDCNKDWGQHSVCQHMNQDRYEDTHPQIPKSKYD